MAALAAFSRPSVTSDVARFSLSQGVSQILSGAEAALGKTKLIWLMCISEMLWQAEAANRVTEGHGVQGGV